VKRGVEKGRDPVIMERNTSSLWNRNWVRESNPSVRVMGVDMVDVQRNFGKHMNKSLESGASPDPLYWDNRAGIFIRN